MHRLIVLLCMLLVATLLWAVEPAYLTNQQQVNLTMTTANDSARIINFTPDAIDSFRYEIRLKYPNDTSVADSANYTSPLLEFQLYPTVDTTATYVCSVIFATDTQTVTYACIEDISKKTLIDSLVARVNDSIGDSVTAYPELTFFRVRADYAQITYGGDARFSIVTNSLISKDSSITTVADVVDTMVALINALDSSKYFTAYDSATFVQIRGKRGMNIGMFPIDTSFDSSIVQDSTSHGKSRDSTWITIIPDLYKYSGISGYAVLNYNGYTWPGLGVAGDSADSDTLVLQIYSSTKLLSWDTCLTSAPCTCAALSVTTVIGDTLLNQDLKAYVIWTDSSSHSDVELEWLLQHYWQLRP